MSTKENRPAGNRAAIPTNITNQADSIAPDHQDGGGVVGYAAAFDIYRGGCWSPIKLGAGTKFPPPSGFTGHDGADPSYADMMAWAEEEPNGNLAIRLWEDVIGIDTDNYDSEKGDKNGGATIAEAEKRWGKLPYSPRTTSRAGDPVSGIQLYRIPPGVKLVEKLKFPELGLGGVEICQRHHRYVLCWPSVHDKTGQQYKWYGIDGAPLDYPPCYPSDIPELPQKWLEGLTEPTRNGADADPDAAYDVPSAITDGEPSPRVLFKLTEAMTLLYGPSCRHDEIRDQVLGLLRCGKQGEPGVKAALKALQEAFANVVGPDRPAGRPQALDEFRKFIYRRLPNGQWVFSEKVARLLADDSYDDTAWAQPAAVVNGQPGDDDDDETVRTVPWPTLNNAALHGTAGKIVNLVAPHTEADPAAILVQLLAVFGATVGPEPHFVAGNDRHQAIINPLIVGRTNNGAKGTGLAVVEATRRQALAWFDEFTTSGLSSAEGLIEMVRDPSGEPDDNDYDPGVADKRLLVKESEYKSVMVRMRREGNTLGQIQRDAFDCRPLRTLTRKHNKLTATGAHIVVVGHVTPGEFRATLQDSDLSGGTVNRMLICLSRRSRLHSRLGNLPGDVLAEAGTLFEDAYKAAVQRGEMKFTDQFWGLWDSAYRELNRDRPDSRATEATARGVTMVLRLSLLYALIDGKDMIDVGHLDAALALWAYAEHSARWLFSNHELELQRESVGGLANFILGGGSDGRTRTEISADYFKRNKSAKEIGAELAPLVHDGVVIELKEETRGRPIMRYVHRSLRNNESTKHAGQDLNSGTNDDEFTNPEPDGDTDLIREFVDGSSDETCSDLGSSFNPLIRSPGHTTDTNLEPPGGPTDRTPGYTDRVQQALAKARNNGYGQQPSCSGCGTYLIVHGHHRDDCTAQPSGTAA
jgi:hypothetical protein